MTVTRRAVPSIVVRVVFLQEDCSTPCTEIGDEARARFFVVHEIAFG